MREVLLKNFQNLLFCQRIFFKLKMTNKQSVTFSKIECSRLINGKKMVENQFGVENWARRIYCVYFRVLLMTRHALTHYRPAMPFGNRKSYFEGSLSSELSTFKKISSLLKPKI